jgi:hypothetical protein
MTDPINNVSPAGGVNTPAVTPSNNQVGTPDANTVNQLQNQLNAADPAAPTANSNSVSPGSGISAADMKLFMDEVTKFCVQQGISTTPKATRD